MNQHRMPSLNAAFLLLSQRAEHAEHFAEVLLESSLQRFPFVTSG
jgi:hypothetical protein